MSITKEQFTEGVVDFIERYNRLPYMAEDDVLITIDTEDKDLSIITEVRPYRAVKYTTEYFETTGNLINELLNSKGLSNDKISKIIDISEKSLLKLLNKEGKSPTPRIRRQLELFYGEDLYPELEKYSKTCSDCACGCEQPYYVTVVSCPKYKKKTVKKKEAKAKTETKKETKKETKTKTK